MSETKPRNRAGRRPVILAVSAVAAIAASAAVYEMTAGGGNGAAACEAAPGRAAAMAPLARGEVAALVVADEARPVPDLAFTDAEGGEHRLSDWRGRTVLLNLWATWCAPCREEMPALDNLQAELGSDDFEVVAVSIDTGDVEAPKAFLDEIDVTRLDFYIDPTTRVFQELKAVGRGFGMPTTLIVDPEGCELGYLAGPAQWDAEDALDLMRAAMAGPR